MLQGDFNHMANIITVLFEQIIARSNEKTCTSFERDTCRSSNQNEHKIFINPEITKYDFFETVYQITSVLGQTNPCIVSALIMIDRVAVKNPEFTIDRENVQRLFIVAVSATCKMYDDFYFTNKSWCELAGMDIRSYNIMETHLIEMVDYEFHISQSFYNKYCSSLINFIEGMQKDLKKNYAEMCYIACAQSETQSEVDL